VPRALQEALNSVDDDDSEEHSPNADEVFGGVQMLDNETIAQIGARVEEAAAKLGKDALTRTGSRAAEAKVEGMTDKASDALSSLPSDTVAKLLKGVEMKIDRLERAQDQKIRALELRLNRAISENRAAVAELKTMGAGSDGKFSAGNYTDEGPTRLEVKGFCLYSKLMDEGILGSEAIQWIQNLFDVVAEGEHKELLDAIDLYNTRLCNMRVLCFKIVVVLRPSGSAQDRQNVAWRLQEVLNQAVGSDESFRLNDKKPYVVVEPPAWKKPMLRAGARMLSNLDELGVEGAQCDWSIPLRVFRAGVNGGRPLLLASWTDATQWIMDPEALGSVGVDAEQLQARLQD